MTGSTDVARSPYIVSRTYDWWFFLATPMLALTLGVLVSGWPSLTAEQWQLASEQVGDQLGRHAEGVGQLGRRQRPRPARPRDLLEQGIQLRV